MPGVCMWLCVKGQWWFFGEKINLGNEDVEVLGMKLFLIHTWKKLIALQGFESRMLYTLPFSSSSLSQRDCSLFCCEEYAIVVWMFVLPVFDRNPHQDSRHLCKVYGVVARLHSSVLACSSLCCFTPAPQVFLRGKMRSCLRRCVLLKDGKGLYWYCSTVRLPYIKLWMTCSQAFMRKS